MYRIVTKCVHNLTPYEYELCRRNNFRKEGMMQESLRQCRSVRQNQHKVFMIYKENDFVGWALALKAIDGHIFVQFYVKKRWRRKGIGSALVKRVKDYYCTIVVEAHDDTSARFFYNQKLISRQKARAYSNGSL